MESITIGTRVRTGSGSKRIEGLPIGYIVVCVCVCVFKCASASVYVCGAALFAKKSKKRGEKTPLDNYSYRANSDNGSN